MFNVYDVANRVNNGMLIAAENEDRAKAVAIRFRHSRKEKNLRAVDITAKMRGDTAWGSLKVILDAEREGRLYKSIPRYTLNQVLGGVNLGGGTWHIELK